MSMGPVTGKSFALSKASTPGCRIVPPLPVISTRPAISSGAIYPASVASASQKMILTKGTSFDTA